MIRVVEGLGTTQTTMNNFLENVQAHYFNNYYHNALHACDVTNSASFYIRCGLSNVFNDVKIIH